MTTTEVGVGGGGGERLSFPSHYPPPLTTICHPLSHYFFPSRTLSHLYPPTHPSHPPIHPPPPLLTSCRYVDRRYVERDSHQGETQQNEGWYPWGRSVAGHVSVKVTDWPHTHHTPSLSHPHTPYHTPSDTSHSHHTLPITHTHWYALSMLSLKHLLIAPLLTPPLQTPPPFLSPRLQTPPLLTPPLLTPPPFLSPPLELPLTPCLTHTDPSTVPKWWPWAKGPRKTSPSSPTESNGPEVGVGTMEVGVEVGVGTMGVEVGVVTVAPPNYNYTASTECYDMSVRKSFFAVLIICYLLFFPSSSYFFCIHLICRKITAGWCGGVWCGMVLLHDSSSSYGDANNMTTMIGYSSSFNTAVMVMLTIWRRWWYDAIKQQVQFWHFSCRGFLGLKNSVR